MNKVLVNGMSLVTKGFRKTIKPFLSDKNTIYSWITITKKDKNISDYF